jgi:hypothetical protein
VCTISFPQPWHRYMPDHPPFDPGSCSVSNSSFVLTSKKCEYLYHAINSSYDAFCFPQRALAALRALRRRCSGVMPAARALPPILPPSRPSSDRICERMERTGCSVSGSLGRSPSNLWTAMKPACTSSSGSLPDGFRIRYQRGTIRRTASSPRKFKVAHYPIFFFLIARLLFPRQPDHNHDLGSPVGRRHSAFLDGRAQNPVPKMCIPLLPSAPSTRPSWTV